MEIKCPSILVSSGLENLLTLVRYITISVLIVTTIESILGIAKGKEKNFSVGERKKVLDFLSKTSQISDYELNLTIISG